VVSQSSPLPVGSSHLVVDYQLAPAGRCSLPHRGVTPQCHTAGILTVIGELIVAGRREKSDQSELRNPSPRDGWKRPATGDLFRRITRFH
jgi:hypothetical protein